MLHLGILRGNFFLIFKGEFKIAISWEILIGLSWERKIVESSNLVKLVSRSTKIFKRKPSKIFFDKNALLNYFNIGWPTLY